MRINAANGVDCSARAKDNRVAIKMGAVGYTATAEEANEFARQILEAVRDLERRVAEQVNASEPR